MAEPMQLSVGQRLCGQKRKRNLTIDDSAGTMSDAVVDVNPVDRALFELADVVEDGSVPATAVEPAKKCLLKVFNACKQSDVSCADILADERVQPLLKWLDLDAWGDDVARSARDDFVAYVCSVIGHMAVPLEPHSAGSCKSGAFRAVLRSLLHLLYESPLKSPRDSWTAVVRQACDAVTSLSRENRDAKRVVYDLGGIPALVRLLDSVDCKMQRAAAAVLKTMAFKEDLIKSAIVESGALQPLVRMLRSEDHQTHYEAVGTLGNLVHSSPEIKKMVLAEGALQPIINLLKCSCRDSLREAALLVGQFAQCDARRLNGRGAPEVEDYRVKIVQRGAVPPLIGMLKTNDRALREMAAFALGRLAQNTENQAGIFAMGVLQPLLDLLSSKVRNLEHNAAFTLYGLADNADNIPDIVKCGGYERLKSADFADDQPTKDCVAKTLKRIAAKVQETAFVKDHLMRLLQSKTPGMRQRIAVCLAHLLEPDDIATAYTAYGGAQVLLDVVCSPPLSLRHTSDWFSAVEALMLLIRCCEERKAAVSTTYVPRAPEAKVYIGKVYVNNPRVHDVVFLVEGEPFYAHKLALAASSEAFSAMFESGCREGSRGIPSITIPNISRTVFQAMMMFIYTGDAGLAGDLALSVELLHAADQYLLDELKGRCAETIAKQLTPANVMAHYELALECNCVDLARSAATFLVAQQADPTSAARSTCPSSYANMLCHVRETLECYFEMHLHSSDSATLADSARSLELMRESKGEHARGDA